jgi:DNA-binding winged helix-turn-helix (wHTH) protein
MQSSHQISEQNTNFLEFDDLHIYVDQPIILRVPDGATFPIRPKEQKLLIVLLNRLGETVTYKEVWAAVWPEIRDFQAARHTMTETKSTLDKLLRDILGSPEPIIETVKRQGYCLKPTAAKVGSEVPGTEPTIHPAPTDTTIPGEMDQSSGEPILHPGFNMIPSSTANDAVLTESAATVWSAPLSMLATHPAHLLGSCSIYSLSYVCILLLEISYKFDQFGTQALLWSPFIFLWIFTTSLLALALDWKLTWKGSSAALPLAILTVIGAALILDLALNLFFLPAFPITEAAFQAHTAQGAYLKNIVLYFLPLVVAFLIVPFHFVTSLRKRLAGGDVSLARNSLNVEKGGLAPKSAIQPKTLGWLLFVAGVICMFLTFRLLDSLKTGPYMNLFTLLVMFRLLLYFGLGTECLLWYYRTLEDLKQSFLAK